MALIFYKATKFRQAAMQTIARASLILEEYAEKGYDLTLRQLYYQFVARGIIANNQREYKNLGSIINDARLAGLIDWDHIVDRTRNVRRNPHWDAPSEIVASCAKQYQIDKWADQPNRVEVWIEKDALIGVVERACTTLDMPYFSCRGYVSQSEIHEAAKDRFRPWEDGGQDVTVLHFGDHDPSGIDMSRDIQDRLAMFDCHAQVRRIALTMAQVRQYNPPPNPAKITDSRATSYIRKYGDESWELDALSPEVIEELILTNVADLMDRPKFEYAKDREKLGQDELARAAKQWPAVSGFLAMLPKDKSRPKKPKKRS